MANPDLPIGALTKKAMRAKPSLKKKANQAADRKSNKAVKERSGGRCEVKVLSEVLAEWHWRCQRAATQVHHLIGGRGKRGIGISALAEHKQHVCDQCHLAITGDIGGKKLIRVGGVIPHWTDRYKRVA